MAFFKSTEQLSFMCVLHVHFYSLEKFMLNGLIRGGPLSAGYLSVCVLMFPSILLGRIASGTIVFFLTALLL